MAGVTRVAILGGGPAGYEAALVAAQLGAEVTVVERDGLGGSAVLTDCVPSKTLVATAETMIDVTESPSLGCGWPRTGGDRRPGVVDSRVKRLALGAVGRHRRPAGQGGRPRCCAARPAGRHRAGCRRAGRRRDRVARCRRRPRRDRRAPARAAGRRAGRRADPHLGAGLRPGRAAGAPRSWSAPA